MSVTALIEREQRLRAEAPGDLLLSEAATVVPASLREAIIQRAGARGIKMPPNTELLQIVRPGIGRGRGKNYYGPQVLESDASNWRGARMFVNHETDKQRRERQNLPRPVEHLGGRIVESWWDGDVPPSDRFEQGGVYGFVRVVPKVQELIDTDPQMVEASISAFATSKTPGQRRGEACSVVEGIRRAPRSVDWIAGEGGAGGMVLTEAEEEEAVLDSMTDDDLEQHIRDERPGLLEALAGDPGGEGEEEQMAEVTPEVLATALASDAGREAIDAAVAAALQEHTPGIDPDEVERLVEARVRAEVAEQADALRMDQQADFERREELRVMQAKAVELIEGAKLHEALASDLRGRFRLAGDGTPTPELDVSADFDDEGNVTRPAIEKLTEAVQERIVAARQLQADVGRKTAVRGQGSANAQTVTPIREAADGEDGGEGKKGGAKPTPTTGSELADEMLESAGFSREQLDNLWATA